MSACTPYTTMGAKKGEKILGSSIKMLWKKNNGNRHPTNPLEVFFSFPFFSYFFVCLSFLIVQGEMEVLKKISARNKDYNVEQHF